MVERVLGSAYFTVINAMISRAEAACERYRQAALEEGLSPAIVARRRSSSQTMGICWRGCGRIGPRQSTSAASRGERRAAEAAPSHCGEQLG